MSGLGRRVGTLEQLAERERRRRWQAVADVEGITLDDLVAIYAEAQAEVERLQAEGLTDDAIMTLKANRIGIPVEELRRRADELVRRLS